MRYTGTTFECWICLQPRMSTYSTSSLGSDRSEEKVDIVVSYDLMYDVILQWVYKNTTVR